MSTRHSVRTWSPQRLLSRALLILAVATTLAGCAGLPQGPTYTDDELRVICERRGGWWRGEVIAGYCEYQTASFP